MPRLVEYFLLIGLFILSIILSYVFCRILIKVQVKKHISQPIHALGVKTHKKKSGTPLFGGVAFFIVPLILISIVDYQLYSSERRLGFIIGLASMFLVGLIDDLMKSLLKDEKGFSALARIILESCFALISLLFMGFDENFSWKLSLYPFNSDIFIGIFYLLLCVFLIVASANSCNLLDGLDGLSSGTSLIALATIMIFAFLQNDMFIGSYVLLLCGALLGFLILNSHPAKIFMGDCGSLFLGASIAYCLIYLDKLVLLPFVAILYVGETMSVIIQVLYFKMTHKRVFLMAPLHHHFELKKVPEYKITVSYYLIQTAIMIILVMMRVYL